MQQCFNEANGGGWNKDDYDNEDDKNNKDDEDDKDKEEEEANEDNKDEEGEKFFVQKCLKWLNIPACQIWRG